MAQAAEPPHVDHVAHRVHDAAGGEEQEGLEERVGEQVKHGRHDRELGDVAHARPERHEHVAELADRRIGQHALQVGLRDGDRRRQEGGRAAGRPRST